MSLKKDTNFKILFFEKENKNMGVSKYIEEAELGFHNWNATMKEIHFA